jgi:protocatechuate 3,4-dioxygenase beta subunit
MSNRFLSIWAAWAIMAAGWALAAERATATGNVTDATGKPLEHAAVLVYEAHVKKGYSIYCPTCWVDCGKRAFTDAEGISQSAV